MQEIESTRAHCGVGKAHCGDKELSSQSSSLSANGDRWGPSTVVQLPHCTKAPLWGQMWGGAAHGGCLSRPWPLHGAKSTIRR